jgi:hypothetical protein
VGAIHHPGTHLHDCVAILELDVATPGAHTTQVGAPTSTLKSLACLPSAMPLGVYANTNAGNITSESLISGSPLKESTVKEVDTIFTSSQPHS